jgi:hypothetical protein
MKRTVLLNFAHSSVRKTHSSFNISTELNFKYVTKQP